MGKRTRVVASAVVLVGLIGTLAAAPVVGEAADMGNAKMTWSLAKDYTPSSWTNEVGWGSRAKSKLGFGLKNVFLGWTELITEPKRAIDEGDNFFIGLGAGVKNGVLDTLGGALHAITFPLTELDVPLPAGGTQLLG